MDLSVYRSFSEEIKRAGVTEMFGALKERAQKGVEGATSKVKDVAHAASEAAGHKAHDLGAAVAEGMAHHAPAVGQHLGAGIAQHAEPVGEAMGRGMAKHFGNAGSELLHGARRAAEETLKNPKVRAGLGAGALALGGLKAHSMYRQHERDKDQRRIADALESLSKKKGR